MQTTDKRGAMIEYGERWFMDGRCLSKRITEAEARARHCPGSYYCAHVKRADGTAYHATVSHQGRWAVQITHLDPIGRREKTLIYSEREGRMFLEQTMRWWWRPETPVAESRVDSTRFEAYNFKTDGKFYLTVTDRSVTPETRVETEGYCTLEDNWVDQMPDFGNDEIYTRFERKVVEIPAPAVKRRSKGKEKKVQEKPPEKAWTPRSGVRFTCVATRSSPLTAREKATIEGLLDSLSVAKLFNEKSAVLGLNWEPFWHYPESDGRREGETVTIFGGETILSDNTDRAMLVGVQYWCQVFTHIRRAVPDAKWEVFTEDHEMVWDAATQAYDPDQ